MMTSEAPPRSLDSTSTRKREGILPAPQVLILEEDGALRAATRMLLEAEGYRVMTAASLSAAREVARQEPGIEVLLVEEHLPGDVLGTQAIASIREIIGPRLRALLITQHISSGLRALEQDGQVRVAVSPIEADALVAKLQALRGS